MRPFLATLGALALALASAAGARAATLTITPDQGTYAVGDTITLEVLGDSEGELDLAIFGRLLFDAGLAQFVSAQQSTLQFRLDETTVLFWIPGVLDHGPGFAEAFQQTSPGQDAPTDVPLMATVTLRATAPGVLDYAWQTEGDDNFTLRFFSLNDAPGGSVTIVPEPATGLLVALGLGTLAAGRRSR